MGKTVMSSIMGQLAIAEVQKVLDKGVADLQNLDRALENSVAKLRARKAELLLEMHADIDPREHIEKLIDEQERTSTADNAALQQAKEAEEGEQNVGHILQGEEIEKLTNHASLEKLIHVKQWLHDAK